MKTKWQQGLASEERPECLSKNRMVAGFDPRERSECKNHMAQAAGFDLSGKAGSVAWKRDELLHT